MQSGKQTFLTVFLSNKVTATPLLKRALFYSTAKLYVVISLIVKYDGQLQQEGQEHVFYAHTTSSDPLMAGGKLELVEVIKAIVMIPTYVLVANLCEGDRSAQDRLPKAPRMGQTREWETTEAHTEHAGSSFPMQGSSICNTSSSGILLGSTTNAEGTCCTRQPGTSITYIWGPSAKPTKSKESFTFLSVEAGFNEGLDNRYGLI